MKNLNACLASLNLGLPDDVRRLKEAGYYTEAIACIDTYLAEDWTKTQNQPVQPAGPLPENPTPRGVDAMRDALLAQREILRRIDAALADAERAGAKIAFVDGAVIVGTPFEQRCDALILVTAPYDTSVVCICERDGIAPEMARRRLDAQMPLERLCAADTAELDNDGTPEQQRRKLQSILHGLEKEEHA